MTDQPLSMERLGDIAVLSGGGTLSGAFVRQLADACASVPDDTRALLLHPDAAVWSGYDGVSEAGDLFAAFAELAQPTISALSASTGGGGLELALAADIRVASPDIRIGLNAVSGAFPQAGGLQRLTRTVGRSRATQLIMLESRIDAATALDWGLVNAVSDDPFAAAMEIAEHIATRGPIAARYAKDALRHGLEMPLAQALHYETELTILLQDTSDRAEGVEAFVAKRTPQFTGT